MTDTVPIRKPSSIVDRLKEMQDQIMRRAYEIFEQNGSVLGRDLENWVQAEHELVWKPAFELCEKDGKFQLEVAISGVDARDINVEVTPEDILLTADTRHEHTERKGVVHHCEFERGKMFRAIHLPKKIDPEQVNAEFKNGLLRLTAHVAEEARAKTVRPEAA
jgi:HSP20 family molecular chaperone IbpA